MKKSRSTLAVLLVTSLLCGASHSRAFASPQRAGPLVAPPEKRIDGKTYAEWSAAWWQWLLTIPVVPGNPVFCDPFFDITLGQSGSVWFLAAPFGTCSRTIAIPAGTRLFVGLINAEASSLGSAPFFGCTEAGQGAAANAFANHIQNPSIEINGARLRQIRRYRFKSPQFDVTLPVPNILGVPAGSISTCPYVPAPLPMQAKAVSDGYWAMIRPLPLGQHTIHFSGMFKNTPYGDFGLDMTYDVTVF